MNDSLLSKTISYLRFPLIVGVVFIHSNILVVKIQGEMIRFDNWPFVTFIMNLFSTVFADVCVPLFFFISGFLFFYNSDFTKETYLAKLKKRIKTLLVPYLIWNFVGFVLLLIYVHPKVLRFFPLLNNYRVDIVSFLSSFWVVTLTVFLDAALTVKFSNKPTNKDVTKINAQITPKIFLIFFIVCSLSFD